ncbi:hypothetical protein sS8_5208 [Methylocaldum marinum]|uniref:Uncharacterized protein n=2 Tax=Methylocaldum marinum TaxID=1432792 RepID=A0A250KZS0_9GAMM|nr:hypothetical protein sS8_5208 [Methylocaldum marinum]
MCSGPRTRHRADFDEGFDFWLFFTLTNPGVEMFYEVKPLVLILIGAAVVMSRTSLAIPFAVLLIGLGAFIMGMRFIYRSERVTRARAASRQRKNF